MHPKLYTFAPEVPFADGLARWVLTRYGAQPEQLAQVIMLVPSRRACGALQEAFLRVSEGKGLLLPRIFPLGMGDEDLDTLLASVVPSYTANYEAILPEVSSAQRVFVLTQRIRDHHAAMTDEQAVALAMALAAVLDDFAKEQVPLHHLRDVVRDDFAQHWQLSLDFLELVIRDWPVWLQEHGKMDAVARRNAMFAVLSAHFRQAQVTTPVIAAGTTGSIPATAELLEVIAQLPHGAVVLPALDVDMSPECWELLGATHPQYGMMRLLKRLEVDRAGVEVLDAQVPMFDARRRWLNEALLPAQATHLWTQTADVSWLEDAVQGVTWVECDTQEQEAFAIALAMREVLEDAGNTAMLVTHDRALARTVSAALASYGVEIDDSAGTSLWLTPSAVFVRLVLEACASALEPVALLALLRHPLCGLGLPIAAVRHASRMVEKRCLRGFTPNHSLDHVLAQVEAWEDTELAQQAHAVLSRLRAGIAPLLALFEHAQPAPFASIMHTLLQVATTLADTDTQQGAERLWGGMSGGKECAAALREVVEHAPLLGEVAPRYVAGVLEQLVGGVMYRPVYQKHPRLRILSPIEARMQTADMVILGGLNEGVWPAAPSGDPWLSQAMRADLQLAEHERSVGLAAHDFYHLFMSPRILITRAKKVQGSPMIASRWLLRLQARLGANGAAQQVLESSSQNLMAWVAQWQCPAQIVAYEEPTPCPPVEARPKRWSVTKIEKLMRDPYSVYAERILRLRALDELDASLKVSDFGNAVHRAMELYHTRYPHAAPANVLAEILACGKEAFVGMLDNLQVQGFWWPRFERIAREMAAKEAELIATGRTQVLVEKEYSMRLLLADGDAHSVSARIDRVDVFADNRAVVIDYKTGAVPKMEDIKRGLACQLILAEAILAQQHTPHYSTITSQYWKISGGKSPLSPSRGSDADKGISPDGVVEMVTALLEHYNLKDSVYLSCPVPEDAPKYNDYDYLARRAEWANG